jgi:hypothetical protein
MKTILPAAKAYLQQNSKIRTAGLLMLELPASTVQNPLFTYMTDYSRDVVYNGILFQSGKLKTISSHKQSRDLSIGTLSFTVTGTDNAEVTRLVQDGVSFVDRKVIIYQAVIDSNGTVMPTDPDSNGALIYFEGRITGGGIKDDLSGNGTSTITWSCSNQFYDFDRVNGRLTDDASHRGLEVINGTLQPSGGAKKPEYQEDYGFFHSNTSVNILAKYQAKELRYKMESKSKFFGLSKSYNLVEYYETVTKEVDMDFNLTAKYIPAVYGVQKVPGIPVFVDTDKNDPKQVWVVYAFAEGEIEGFLDVQFDDAPMICYDDSDRLARTCFGVKRSVGDTMQRLASGVATSAPSVHGQEYLYNDGNGEIRMWTFHGLANQTAAQVLVDKAANRDFYLQTQNNNGPEYWDSRYKLLDTAYLVMRFTITENRTNIPAVSAEISGKKVKIYGDTGLISSNTTSTNGAWQTLDYLTSSSYGAGLTLDDVSLSHVVNVAKLLDIIDTSYEPSWVPYWRYLGWKDTTPGNRTIVQLNTVLDTSISVFKLLQDLLDHYKGALNSLNGKYCLTVEKYAAPVISIGLKDTVSGFTLDDTTGKDKFNSVQAALIEPGFAWKSNSISFFNSDYKAQDKNLEKKLQLAFSYITNYYTARSMAERELKKSRYSRYLSFTLPYSYIGLEPNDPIFITNARYGWKDKFFLVDEVENTRDGKLNISVREYADNVFINSGQTDNSGNQIPDVSNNVLPPRDVKYTPTPPATDPLAVGKNGEISWLPSLTTNVVYYTIHMSNQLDPFIIQVGTNSDANLRMIQEIKEKPAGLYVFEVRAVDILGRRSAPVTLSVNMDAAKNLSIVENFRALNAFRGDDTEFVGPDLLLAWDKLKEETLIPGIFYTLELYDRSNVMVRSVRIANQYTYDYLLSFNKTDYRASHSNVLGINRSLICRIRAEGPRGEQSVAWAYI